jgi:hypothetical protein
MWERPLEFVYSMQSIVDMQTNDEPYWALWERRKTIKERGQWRIEWEAKVKIVINKR